MPTSTLMSKGQITVPKEVRAHLSVAPGDRLDFVIVEDGSVHVVATARPVRELFGMLASPGRGPASPAATDDSIMEVVASEDHRIRRGG